MIFGCESRCVCQGRLLVVDSVEFLDHLVGQIDGVLTVDHNLDRLFTALVDNESKPAFFRHGFRG